MWVPFPPLALTDLPALLSQASRFHGFITGCVDLALALLYLLRDANGSDATIAVYWVAL